jgi:rhamnulokinase
MRSVSVAAVDLGASSGRVLVGTGCAADGFELREVHRFPNGPVLVDGVLRWDIDGLFCGVLDGLRAAARAVGRLDSIGVDSWAVDYGLLDTNGRLLAAPAHYRDGRTAPIVDQVLAGLSAAELYAATGIALQPFNTVFQLLADLGSSAGDGAVAALLIPDLITLWLTGVRGTELTNASTTSLLDPRTMTWSLELAARLGVPIELFAPIRRPGDEVGALLPGIAADTGLDASTRVVTVASHDTAAAVAGIPAEVEDFAFVCTGTWALVGLELPGPVITENSRAANFTNEVGTDGTIRFLRNVTGFWLLQECVREWQRDGQPVDLNTLTGGAEQVPALTAIIDVVAPAFAEPGGMPARISDAAERLSGRRPRSRAEIARCILDSVALGISQAVREATTLADRGVSVVHVVGGGVSNELFCQLIADACGLPVVAGPVEAASWGNVMSQARALGAIDDTRAAVRAAIRASVTVRRYEPDGDQSPWERAGELVRAARR